jgi:hypothetical protein
MSDYPFIEFVGFVQEVSVMKNYKKCATIVQILAAIIISTHVVITILHWFFPLAYKALYHVSGLCVIREFDATRFSVGQKISGFSVEAVASCLLIYGLILVIRLMAYIKQNQYFSLVTILLLKRITKVALIYVIYAIACGALLSLVASWQNAPGTREIALSFGTPDIINIMIFCCMYLVLTMLQKGYELKHEQELTI